MSSDGAPLGNDSATPLAMARNLAGWHDSSVQALGLRPRVTDAWWVCPTPGPNIYHTAISRRPAADIVDRNQMMLELRDHLEDPDLSLIHI